MFRCSTQCLCASASLVRLKLVFQADVVVPFPKTWAFIKWLESSTHRSFWWVHAKNCTQRCDAPQEAKAKQTGGSQSARELRCLGCKSLFPRHLSCLPVWTFPYGIVICLNQLLQQLVRSDTRVTIRLLRKRDTLDFITIVNFYIYNFFCFNIYNIHPPPCCIKTLITYLSLLTTSFCLIWTKPHVPSWSRDLNIKASVSYISFCCWIQMTRWWGVQTSCWLTGDILCKQAADAHELQQIIHLLDWCIFKVPLNMVQKAKLPPMHPSLEYLCVLKAHETKWCRNVSHTVSTSTRKALLYHLCT